MRYCPECEAEYLEGITECADCEVPLVDQLPSHDPREVAETKEKEEGEFVTVYETNDAMDFRMAKGLLESNGFHCKVIGGNDPTYPLPAQIQVRADEVKEAESLLASPGQVDFNTSDEF